MKRTVTFTIISLLYLSMFAAILRVELSRAQPLIFFHDGFETGDYTEWTGSQSVSGALRSITSAVKHNGSYADNITLPSGRTNPYGLEYKVLDSNKLECYGRCYMKWESFYTANGQNGRAGPGFRNLLGEGIVWSAYRHNSSGWYLGVNYWSNGGYRSIWTPFLFQADTWYCIELYCRISDGQGTIQLWVDGDIQINGTSLDTDDKGLIRSYVVLHYMALAEPGARTLFIDDCFASDSYIGPSEPDIPEPDLTIAEMISKINESKLYLTVYDLQNFVTRAYGYPGNTEAGTYLFNRLGNISGLNVEYQGGNIRNIIATLPGVDQTSNANYIVGAHYDSACVDDPNNAPGATDNGGGVAIVLELARIMSQYTFKHTLKFALWNMEEGGRNGSRNFAEYALESAMNISLYFNFDSACYDPSGRMILDIMYNNDSSWVSELVTRNNLLYDTYIPLTYNVFDCLSDHRSFWKLGYTAVMTHSAAHGPQHTVNDTVDKISTAFAKVNGQLCMSTLAGLAEVHLGNPHDIAVTNIISSKTIVGEEYSCDINVTLQNQGDNTETVNVTLHANASTISSIINVILTSGHSTDVTFTWNTTGWTKGNYTLTAKADLIPGETNVEDNDLTKGWVIIGIVGDITGSDGWPDGTCNMRDIGYVAQHFQVPPASPFWDPNCDINGDRKVDMKDIGLTARHFGDTYR